MKFQPISFTDNISSFFGIIAVATAPLYQMCASPCDSSQSSWELARQPT